MRLATSSGRTAIETETLLFDLSQYQSDRYCGINPHVIDAGVDTDLEEEEYLDRLHGKTVLEQVEVPAPELNTESDLAGDDSGRAVLEQTKIPAPELNAESRGWIDSYIVKKRGRDRRSDREYLYWRFNWREFGSIRHQHVPTHRLQRLLDRRAGGGSLQELIAIARGK